MKSRRLLGASAALVLALSATLAQARTKLSIGYVEGWPESVATTFLAAEVIKQKLGYDVDPVPVSIGSMWQGVANGKLDMTLSAWLPVTHDTYWQESKDRVVDYGTNVRDARIGLVVPDYVQARGVADLKSDSTFGKRIVGIDSGSGVMLKTQQALKHYSLTGYRLQAGSGDTMVSELERAIKANKSIVVTGWVPHWMFAKWKLRFLEDPKGAYGATEHIDNVGGTRLEGKAPEVVAFLKKFRWKNAHEMGDLMLQVHEGLKPEEAARAWVASHPERVAEWTGP